MRKRNIWQLNGHLGMVPLDIQGVCLNRALRAFSGWPKGTAKEQNIQQREQSVYKHTSIEQHVVYVHGSLLDVTRELMSSSEIQLERSWGSPFPLILENVNFFFF